MQTSCYRFLGHLKKNVINKAKVEGSIFNFCSHYFEPHVYTRMRKVPFNDDGSDGDEIEGTLSIFKHLDRPYG